MSKCNPKGETKVFVQRLKSAEERFYPSWWDRLLGRARYMNKLNHRNAHIQSLEDNTNEDLELLREAVNDLQPEKVLEQEGKYLDEIGMLKERIIYLEHELRSASCTRTELENELAARKRQSIETRVPVPDPTLIRPDRAQALGRMGYVEPNNGAHATNGQASSPPADISSGLLMQAAVLHSVMVTDSAPARSEPSHSSYDSSSYSSDSGSGCGGGCD